MQKSINKRYTRFYHISYFVFEFKTIKMIFLVHEVEISFKKNFLMKSYALHI